MDIQLRTDAEEVVITKNVKLTNLIKNYIMHLQNEHRKIQIYEYKQGGDANSDSESNESDMSYDSEQNTTQINEGSVLQNMDTYNASALKPHQQQSID